MSRAGAIKPESDQILDRPMGDNDGIDFEIIELLFFAYRDFISNPDLVNRLKNNWPLAERDRTHWYSQGPEGLIDYPVYTSLLNK